MDPSHLRDAARAGRPAVGRLERQKSLNAFELGRYCQHIAVATLSGYQAELAKFHQSREAK